MEAAGTRAILMAYKDVMIGAWPNLHPDMVGRSQGWVGASGDALQAELDGYLKQASMPGCRVRVFWKLGPALRFGGCNRLFAEDAGIPVPALVGLDDHDPRLPWFAQASKYRADDEAIMSSGQVKLDIVERQRSSSGITWVRAAKAPIRTEEGTILGVFGMYEVLDSASP